MLLRFIKTYLILLILVINLPSCTTNVNLLRQNNTIKNHESLAVKEFKTNNIAYHFSPDSIYVLCIKIKESSPAKPKSLTEFLVVDLINKKVIYNGKIDGAQVTWHSNHELLFKEIKGYIESPEDSGKIIYTYHLKTKKKTLINSNKNFIK